MVLSVTHGLIKLNSFLVSHQVGVAFGIVYESGLNEYALYLNCEGVRGTHKGYERTMTHLFKNYMKQWLTHKVSVSHGECTCAPCSHFVVDAKNLD